MTTETYNERITNELYNEKHAVSRNEDWLREVMEECNALRSVIVVDEGEEDISRVEDETSGCK